MDRSESFLPPFSMAHDRRQLNAALERASGSSDIIIFCFFFHQRDGPNSFSNWCYTIPYRYNYSVWAFAFLFLWIELPSSAGTDPHHFRIFHCLSASWLGFFFNDSTKVIFILKLYSSYLTLTLAPAARKHKTEGDLHWMRFRRNRWLSISIKQRKHFEKNRQCLRRND